VDEAIDWAGLGEEAVQLLRRYLMIDTTNPPGNETAGVAFLEAVLARENIPCETAEAAPGRGNLVARLAGDGTRPGLVLHHHIDVVPADRRHWSVDPFGGVVQDGYLYGRGALDMKSTGVLQLMAVVAIKRAGIPLRGDVVLLATADEEDDSELGAEFVARHRAGWLAGADAAVSELGGILDTFTLTRPIGVIGVSEKTPLPLRLTARGHSGHGSAPWPHTAPNRLVRALGRLLAAERPPRLLAETRQFFATLASALPTPRSLEDSDFTETFLANPAYAAAVRTSFALTLLRAGDKRNVVPAEATAEIDCRILTGDDPDEVVEWVRRIIEDDQVEVTAVRPPKTPNLSPIDTPVYQALADALRRRMPNVSVTPAILTGLSDSWVFRRSGLQSYGFSPFVLDESELFRVHGVDERVSLENIRAGVRTYTEVLLELLGPGRREAWSAKSSTF
jgi:acetylornithine deacetylase/succinyl-diaminopimelate desuccinylase-like protein